MSEITTFLGQVETFISAHEMSPTQFGKKFAGDPLLVFQLREGREPRTSTRERILAAMQRHAADCSETAA